MSVPARRLDIHVQAPVGGRPGSDPASVVELARLVEAAGLDGLVLVDHVVMGEHPEQYPLGTFTYPPDSPWLDPMITLGAAAAVTSRIQLVTSVLVAPLRGPGVLASEVATIDALAPGRLQLGVGVGWQREEYVTNRLDFAERGRLLDDTIGACQALWADAPAAFDGPTVSFERVWCEPRPADGGPPVLLGGMLNPRNVGRIVRWRGGWMPHPMAPLEEIASGIGLLRDAYQRAGLDPSTLRVNTFNMAMDDLGRPDVEATLAGLQARADLGVSAVAIPIGFFAPDPASWPGWLETVAPLLRQEAP